MTTTINYSDFTEFATKMNNSSEYPENDTLDAIKILHDNYSTFMVTKKYYKKEKYNNDDIINYYKNNIVDNFNKKLDPPKCFFTEVAREKRLEAERELFERETDDIYNHYDSINEKYKYFNELSQKNNNEESDYDEEYFEESEDDYYSTTDSDDFYDYYYSDYDTDYLSDE
jgi:hypothetical protein